MRPNETVPAQHAPDEGTLTERSLTLWVHTEELWRDLEAAAGLSCYELGRFKEWAALGPKHFGGDNHDLDAMIQWAREHGIPYTEERAVHYAGTTGIVDPASEELTLAPGQATPGD